MPWSIFTQGGGAQEAKGWAQELLQKIGAPASPGNLQFVYDWEESEGGGGQYNPLNQGPVPGQPGLTTSGAQFGGGAANFASWAAGLQGADDYLHMPQFQSILSALKANNPAGARQALFDSPWAASHYGYGSAWSNAAVPGGKPVLPPAGGADSSGSPAQAQLTSAAGSSLLGPAQSLLHGVAVVLDRAFAMFAPGQGWRLVFGAVALLLAFLSFKAFTGTAVA